MSQFKIISSNIRFENPQDGFNDWPNRRSLLSHIIMDFKTSILLTQEGREPQLRNLESLLPNLTIIDHHREWIKDRMYPCIFIDKNIYDMEDSGDIWLSKTPSIPGSSSFKSAFPRLSTWAKVSVKKSSKKILIINIHLDHIRKETRQEQIKVCLSEVNNINSDNLPIIFSGDFNESPFSNVRKEINSTLLNLVDPWQELKYEEMSSHHRFNGDLTNGNRIDWILIDKKFFTIIDMNFDQTCKKNIYPSDHLPLKLTLRM